MMKRLTKPTIGLTVLVLGLAALLGQSPALAADPPADKAQRPNIIFIMADDHAAHAITAYGSKVNETPNIDRLATDGMLLRNCFATNSICTPSRATILTGKYSHINGVPVFNEFDGSQPHLAKYLQAAGYYTGMIGKWHLGSDPTGFDYWDILPGQGDYHNPEFITMGKRHRVNGYCTDLIVDFSIEFIENRPKDKPFFLMSHHKAPHRSWEPDEKHKAEWADREIPVPETFNDDYATRSDAAREATMRIDQHLNFQDVKGRPPQGLSAEERKLWLYTRYMQDYLACIASVDDNVGRLLDYLDENDLADNTMVIYTSDQGFFLGDHNWFDKRFMYEESIRMPFLVRWPGVIEPGSVSDAMVINADFAPMMMAAAGLDVPEDMQGRDFLPVLKGETPDDWRTSWYYRYYHYPQHHQVQPHYGVRTERYKLIYYNRIDQWEFFDLEKDPNEMNNVYDDEAYAEIIEELKKEGTRLKKELGDEEQFADRQPPTDNRF